jgi:MFS family permease
MSVIQARLFTPRFFVMCGFTFTVFLSAFQLLPTAPFRVLALGGSKFAAGLFLGFLTYASALSAPFTGALADRFGKRRILIVSSLSIAVFSTAYAFISTVRVLLAVVLVHGVFWSALMTASAAYLTDLIPSHRRGEGIGYYGVATILAISVAPSIGLWIYQFGWVAVCVSAGLLNLAMALIAVRLKEVRVRQPVDGPFFHVDLVEWRVFGVALTLFLYAFGYGGITSFVALYATANGVTPAGIYFTAFATATVLTRPFAGPLGDRVGHVRVLVPCLALVVIGYTLLALGGTRPWLLTSAIVFGIGFGSAYPMFAAHIMRHVDMERRGAAFGGILAALDTGVGSGSIVMGWIINRYGFSAAYATAACLAALSIPYFLIANRRLLWNRVPSLKEEGERRQEKEGHVHSSSYLLPPAS